MPVLIKLPPDYQLCTKPNNPNLLFLPQIEIAKNEKFPNEPQIFRIKISVTGTPSDIAKQIESSYTEFNSKKPFILSTTQALRQKDCKIDGPLPPDVNCTLQVTVDFYNSDLTGKPFLAKPQQTIVKSNIWTSSSPTTSSPTSSSPTSSSPTVSSPTVSSPSTSSPSTSSSTTSSSTTSSVQTPVEREEKPKVGKKGYYPGWFAIDFGTSNSTVTLYDPKVIASPDSLPREQEQILRQELADWLDKRPQEEIPGTSAKNREEEWERLIQEVCKNFNDINSGDHHHLGDQLFLGSNINRLLEVLRQIEICLAQRPNWFRATIGQQLNQIYHKAFRIPPLEWQSLIPVELDPLRRLTEIESELEIEIISKPLRVLMGASAKQHRLDAIAQGENIEGRFFHSPKRYFGQDRVLEVALNGKKDKIKVEELIQAAYAHIIDSTENDRQRNSGQRSAGDYYRAVLTYPTVASPFVRRKLEESVVQNLNIKDVQIAYDEAVAVAIFFLFREFGGNLNIGIESFKTRCRRYGDKWSQNVLVLDIGGGTTDLALMELTLEEIDPFDPGEDRGDGGRYYKLTPKVLGASGHLQLGGELITLKLFQLLKVAIAECLLTAVAEERLAKDILKVQLEELSEHFLENGTYQIGKLLACVDRENPESNNKAYKDALDTAEKVLPTRWKNAPPSRLQTFYTLWEQAEKAKLTLGKKRDSKDSLEPTFVLEGQEIGKLLAQNEIQLPNELLDSLKVNLTVEQFERAIKPVITEAINIAKGLMENALKHKNKQQKAEGLEKVDWLILSGKTCNLYLVEQELHRVFSKSDYFLWNPERITFEPEYTKLATSAGACYAEKLRQLIFSSENSRPLLRKGANQLYINVKNLSYFLPCTFIREVIGEQPDTIFDVNQQLYQIAPGDSMAKYRSKWLGMQLTNNIQRQDFEGMTPQFWGNYNGDALTKTLDLNESDFRDRIKVQFEINQKLEISLLLCNGTPHCFIDPNLPHLDAAKEMKQEAVMVDDDGKKKVVCDIAVNVAESAQAMQTDAHHLVFSAGKDYSEEFRVFRYDDKQSIGLVAPLPAFPLSGKHTFYFKYREPNTNEWKMIGQLPKPEVKTDYSFRYYVSLEEKGILRVHAFEIPYWTSENVEGLKQEGCVFRDELQLQPNDVEEKRDPFSGIH